MVIRPEVAKPQRCYLSRTVRAQLHVGNSLSDAFKVRASRTLNRSLAMQISASKAGDMGRGRRSGRRHHSRFQLGRLGNGRDGRKNGDDSAQDATVLALTPVCVLKAEQQPDQLVLLKKESSWSRGNFVDKAGWVAPSHPATEQPSAPRPTMSDDRAAPSRCSGSALYRFR